MTIKVRWDSESNLDDCGWVYQEKSGDWQAVTGAVGRDRDALLIEIAAEIGCNLDIEFV